MPISRDHPSLTADSVVVTEDGELLLVLRGSEPFGGRWALPGGFVDPNERAKAAGARELREETGLELTPERLVGVYDKPGRDPRGWTVSVAHLAVVPEALEATGGDDAAEARWWRLDELPLPLAFDHELIIADARALLDG